MYIVFWCTSSGNCCSELLCKTWGEYFSDANGYRSDGAVDRLTTEYLSLVPFFGLSSLYRGNTFDGRCEVINAVMAVISLLVYCCCHTNDRRADAVAAYIAFATVILDLVKVYHMVTMESVDDYEIAVIISSILVVVCCCCACCMHAEIHGIIPALLVTIGTGIMEAFRDNNIDGKDGSGCPFI